MHGDLLLAAPQIKRLNKDKFYRDTSTAASENTSAKARSSGGEGKEGSAFSAEEVQVPPVVAVLGADTPLGARDNKGLELHSFLHSLLRSLPLGEPQAPSSSVVTSRNNREEILRSHLPLFLSAATISTSMVRSSEAHPRGCSLGPPTNTGPSSEPSSSRRRPPAPSSPSPPLPPPLPPHPHHHPHPRRLPLRTATPRGDPNPPSCPSSRKSPRTTASPTWSSSRAASRTADPSRSSASPPSASLRTSPTLRSGARRWSSSA